MGDQYTLDNSVREFFSHGGIPNAIRPIRPKTAQSQNGKLPYITLARNSEGRKYNGLGQEPRREVALKEQFARIFDKNSFRHILSS